MYLEKKILIFFIIIMLWLLCEVMKIVLIGQQKNSEEMIQSDILLKEKK